MQAYIIKSFRGGQSDYEDKGLEGAFKSGTNLSIRRTDDTLTANQALVAEGAGVVVDLIRFMVAIPGSAIYGFGSLGRIYRRDSGGGWSIAYVDPNGPILGAEMWYDNAGTAYLYWATATRLARKPIPGLADWSDADPAWQTNLTTAAWHTMKQVYGTLLICNGRRIALVGYDNSFTTEALNLWPGNLSKCITEINAAAVIGTFRGDIQEESGLYYWDTIALNYNLRRSVPARGVNAVIQTDRAFFQAGTDGMLFYADDGQLLPLTRFSGGGSCEPGAVETDGNLALFGVSATPTTTGVWSYGRRRLAHPSVLNFEHQVTADTIGAIRKVGSDLLIAYRNGQNYGVYRVNSLAKATATYESLDLKAPDSFLNRPAHWAFIQVLTKPLPANTSIACYYKVNKSGSWIQANLEGGSTTFTTTNATEAVFYTGAKARVFEFKLVLTPSGNTAPEVTKVYVHFE